MAFNNHAGSTKSYDYVREHNEAVNRLDFMPRRGEITAEYEPGEVIEVTQHDGSMLRLRKLHDATTPATGSPHSAISTTTSDRGEIVTGLLYVDPDSGRPACEPEHGRDRRSTGWTKQTSAPARPYWPR